MTKNKIVVGIVAAPGLPENLAYQLENELPETLSKYILYTKHAPPLPFFP